MLTRMLRRLSALRYQLLLPAVLLAVFATVMMSAVAAQSPYECAHWTAWIDRMPGPGAVPTLHVQGNCTFRFVGYNPELRPHMPPSADPSVFLLDLIVHAPAGPATPGVEGGSFSYSTNVTSAYQTVLLLPDHVVVPVRQVH